jgi:hypothetical protein
MPLSKSAPVYRADGKKPNLIAEDSAAEYIHMSVAFLQAGRCHGKTGNRTPTPPFYKLGRLVRYDVADLDAWLVARRVDPAARKATLASGVRPKRAAPHRRDSNPSPIEGLEPLPQ